MADEFRQLSGDGLLPAAVSRETSMSGRLRLLWAMDQRGLRSWVSDRLIDMAVACQGLLRRAIPALQEGLADGQRCRRVRCEAYRDPWDAVSRFRCDSSAACPHDSCALQYQDHAGASRDVSRETAWLVTKYSYRASHKGARLLASRTGRRMHGYRYGAPASGTVTRCTLQSC